MSKPKPFPAITGSCVCNKIRYRLLTSPLFCYACHCNDCQKATGTAFALGLNIELYNISIISPTAPTIVSLERKPGMTDRFAACPTCNTELWSMREPVVDVKVGTLDFPSLMEPDAHVFVESKLDWMVLPPGAKTVEKGCDRMRLWPKSSLARYEVCMKRAEEAKRKKGQGDEKSDRSERGEDAEEEGGVEGDKTPTAAGELAGEDDEAFEKRFKETEKALQERLEKLSIKLEEEEEVTKKMEKSTI
ncbi:hypothetical protein BDW02DRAFT_55537 [Decorospora gaudefroyi]|uniref:CENP-V/GFA domain-containing protein n=1 Tax=Decorospora gaudefroyi TaxID=184978 RepID=A0A6A5K5Q3_9PLEO|nr:hypothetical protein BDW02DRAFT_55537 [Decorospora gaudefroyi]